MAAFMLRAGHLSPLSAAPPAHGALPACSSSHVWEAVLWHLLCSAASEGRAALLSTPPSAIRLLCSLLVEKERAESVRPAMRRVWESGVSELGPLVALSRVEAASLAYASARWPNAQMCRCECTHFVLVGVRLSPLCCAVWRMAAALSRITDNDTTHTKIDRADSRPGSVERR